MYPAPTVSIEGATGFGAPSGERVDRRLWRSKGDERVAAVEKIEDQRKPEDFFGYRNRIAPYGGYRSAANRPTNIYLPLFQIPSDSISAFNSFFIYPFFIYCGQKIVPDMDRILSIIVIINDHSRVIVFDHSWAGGFVGRGAVLRLSALYFHKDRDSSSVL